MAAILPMGLVVGKTYEADEAMVDKHRIVTLVAAGHVELCGANEVPQGVLKNAPAIRGQASVITRGEAEVYVDATTAILIGDLIESGASGVGVKVAATAASKRYVLGRAQEALASGTGTIIVDVDPGVVTNPASAG